jgi:RNA polymerase sigma factor (sigma-70 family)
MMNGRHVAASLSVTAVAPVAARLDDAVSAFLRVRPRLFGIAYRMLGDLAEAEDIVQNVWIRWQTTDRSRVQNPPAFLAATTTRLAINELQSARVRREEYGVERLIEAIDASADPETGVERAEALRFAAVLLLEKLSPTERAAYVLREAFDYPYRRIADILRIKEANVRQLVTRARSHVAGRPRAFASSSEERRFLDVLLAACTTGDLTSLEHLLVSKIVPKSERPGHSLSVGPRSSTWARSCRCSRGRRSSRGSARARRGEENSW